MLTAYSGSLYRKLGTGNMSDITDIESDPAEIFKQICFEKEFTRMPNTKRHRVEFTAHKKVKEEVEVKTKKLKKVWNKIQSAKTEIEDIQEEFQRERADLLDNIRELTKQFKLMMLTVHHFIPPDELAKIERRAEWDEENSDWRIMNSQFAGNSV